MDIKNSFLNTIANSEIGKVLLAESDNGYNVLVGSTPHEPLFFESYDDHPNVLNKSLDSTAAGRYQIIHPTFLRLQDKLDTSGFGPDVQDQMAWYLVSEVGATSDLEAQAFEKAIYKCSKEWASLPGSNSGQHMQNMVWLKSIYESGLSG